MYAAKALASLLSPIPGSMIFERHVSTNDGASKDVTLVIGDRTVYGFIVEDWKRLWNGEVFKEGSVHVEAELHDISRTKDCVEIIRMKAVTDPWQALIWSVTRV